MLCGYIQVYGFRRGHPSDQHSHRARCSLCSRDEGKRVIFQLKGDLAGYDDLIAKASSKVPRRLLAGQSRHQGGNRTSTTGPSHRLEPKGLMQLMPATAASLQVRDAFHPETNIDGGVRYLRYLMNLFNGNLPRPRGLQCGRKRRPAE